MKEKITDLIKNLKEYWKIPPQGRYIAFKEIASLAVGGIGVRFIVYCVGQMILNVGNTLIGNTIGIPPGALYVIYIISVLSGFPLTALRAKLIDSSRSIKGKYRPYLLTMGIPTVLLGIGFVLMPYESMNLIGKCITVLIFNIGFQFFYNFYCDSNDSIINVLSPNTIERTDVYAVKSVVENISPSICSIFLPIVAKLITGENTLYNLTVYRVLFPPMLIVGFLISMIMYVNTQERIVQPKNRTVNISFIDAFRSVMGNKYFWIISLAGWIGFLEGSFGTILGWMYNYQEACSAAQYALITAIAGNACLWPNFFGPVLIRRFGKKKVLITSNLLNIVFIACMLPVVKMQGKGVIWIMLIVIFVNQMLTTLGHFLNPSINADIRDYQQYISGERIDGMFAAVGLVGSVITLATGSVLPMIYEKAGLNEKTAVALGYSAENVYDVLYNQELFSSIASVLVTASIVGAALNVIPLFFYDLTEVKQRAMVNILRIRAYFEDEKFSKTTIEQKEEVIGILTEAKSLHSHALIEIKKGMSRAEKKDARAFNEKIRIAEIVWDDINYFNTSLGKAELQIAQNVLTAGVNNLDSAIPYTINEAKKLASATENEKVFKRNIKALLRDFKVSSKTRSKYYSNGVKEFDSSIFNALFDEADDIALKIREKTLLIKKAKEEKASYSQLKEELNSLNRQKAENEKRLKEATKRNTIYNRAVKPYVWAQKCVERSKHYSAFCEK